MHANIYKWVVFIITLYIINAIDSKFRLLIKMENMINNFSTKSTVFCLSHCGAQLSLILLWSLYQTSEC